MAKMASLDGIELEEKEIGSKILDLINIESGNVEDEEKEDESGDILINSENGAKRRSYDEDYSKLLQLKQEMVEIEKTKKPWENRTLNKFMKSISRDKKLLAVVVVLSVIILISLIVIYHLYEEDNLYKHKGEYLVVDGESLHFEYRNELKEKVLSGDFWKSDFKSNLPYDCSKVNNFKGDLCLEWKNKIKLSVFRQSWPSLNLSCHNISWLREKDSFKEEDCFDMEESTWFGGGLTSKNGWPLNQLSFSKQPFLTGNTPHKHVFGSVLEKYWFSSNGVGIFVDESSEIKVSINETSGNETNVRKNQLCISSNTKTSNLKYSVCVAHNMTLIHQKAFTSIFPPPGSALRNHTFVNFTTPFWTAFLFSSSVYNQDNLLSFAKNISKFGYANLLINIGWENRAGDLDFDTTRFQNVRSLMESLHSLNFKIYLAVHTYIEPNSENFQEASLKDYLVKEKDEQVPGLTLWINDFFKNKKKLVGVIDLSKNATEWLKDRLRSLQTKFKIDSFHFIGGSASSLPSQSSSNYLSSDANQYTRQHNKFSSSLGELIPVESAYNSQNLDIVVKMQRKESTWKCIKLVIPAAFSLSFAGYNLFIPEVAGGSINTDILTKELYIRWLQLNVFLPFMHFSIPPDHFDQETVDIFYSLSEFRTSVVSPVLQQFYDIINMNDPLIRPIWWYSPRNEDAISCIDEFVIANKFLFAPILDAGSSNRHVFFPDGIWEDKFNDVYHIGPKWVFNYTVPLNQFIYFVKK